MFHGRISLNFMFLLLENFVSGIRLELMYIPLMVKSIRSSLTQLHGFNLRVAAIVHRNHFFYLYQKNKSSESKVKLSCSTWATQAAPAGALDISKIFDRAWHAVLLHKLKSYGISGQIYGLISSFLSKTASCGSEWQVFTRRLAIHWRPSSWCYLWYCYLCWYYSILSVIRHLICGNNLNWLAPEIESDIRDTVDWSKKWVVDFNAGKTQLFLFDQSHNTGSIDVKPDGSVLKENSSFKTLGLTFSSKLDWCSYIISIPKTASKKIGALICSVQFLSPLLRLFCISLNRILYFMSGLVPLVATWNC